MAKNMTKYTPAEEQQLQRLYRYTKYDKVGTLPPNDPRIVIAAALMGRKPTAIRLKLEGLKGWGHVSKATQVAIATGAVTRTRSEIRNTRAGR